MEDDPKVGPKATRGARSVVSHYTTDVLHTSAHTHTHKSSEAFARRGARSRSDQKQSSNERNGQDPPKPNAHLLKELRPVAPPPIPRKSSDLSTRPTKAAPQPDPLPNPNLSYFFQVSSVQQNARPNAMVVHRLLCNLGFILFDIQRPSHQAICALSKRIEGR